MIKVLIVDDDKLARQGLMTLMNWEKYGMQVVGNVQNGKVALDFVKKEPVDLVFVDIDMPEMNGLEFMEQCSRINAGIQFVVLSFYERFDYVQSTLRLGGLDYISKASMDLENCDEVLDRICTKYEEKKKIYASAQRQEVNEEDLDEMRGMWKSMHWIFDEHFWMKMKERMQNGGIDARRLELLVSNSIGELEYLTGWSGEKPPLFNDVGELISWVEQFRRRLLEMAGTLPQESDIGLIANTVSYMKENFQKEITTVDAAGRIGVSRSSFCTIFKKWTGLSFRDYLQQLRLDAAGEALVNSGKTISEIAFSCGYNDVYYFSRVFHREIGCTPAEYRNLKNVRNHSDDFPEEKKK